MILYIANRGEIARRIIRSAKSLGFKTAVGFADQDKDLPFVDEADSSISLDGEEAKDTYIHFQKVLQAAQKMRATHLHPGYGFLSENSQFVELLQKHGIEFVGPSAASMKLLGDKIGSRNFLKNFEIPLLPSYDGKDQSSENLKNQAEKLGFPLLIKPSAGGGGKGMIRCYSLNDFQASLESAKRIASSAFGDDRVFLEKLVEPARHIEVQILGDKKGNVISIGERECSLQRKHQKIIEESPCLFLGSKVRQTILEASKRLAREADYYSLGTVEWIWDGAEGIYFLEVNTRLQVEHPVTESVWGVDLVSLQLKVALGDTVDKLSLQPSGHSIEARICAEDPAQDFLPSGGKIHRLRFPEKARIDFGYREKNSIPSQFDSMLGKVIVHADNRVEAVAALRQALQSLVLIGPTINRAYLIQILEDLRVQQGELATNLLADIPCQFNVSEAMQMVQSSHSIEDLLEDDFDRDLYSPWGAHLPAIKSDFLWEDFGEKRYFHTAFADWSTPRPRVLTTSGAKPIDLGIQQNLMSPMPAKVNKVLVKPGQEVKKGELLLILEAMKMEHQMKAAQDATVAEVLVIAGARVQADAILIKWKLREADPK